MSKMSCVLLVLLSMAGASIAVSIVAPAAYGQEDQCDQLPTKRTSGQQSWQDDRKCGCHAKCSEGFRPKTATKCKDKDCEKENQCILTCQNAKGEEEKKTGTCLFVYYE